MAEAIIRVMCPNLRCRRILAVPATARGRAVRCRNCGSTVKIPEGQKKTISEPETEELVAAVEAETAKDAKKDKKGKTETEGKK